MTDAAPASPDATAAGPAAKAALYLRVSTGRQAEIDPIHADTVRLIYRLVLTGDGQSGPMGIKPITTHLNERNIRTRDGGRWGIASVHQILTRTTYIGEHRFNTRDHKTRTAKPEAEHAVMAVPPIITKAEYHAVKAALKSRSPQWMPPRSHR